MTVKVDHVQVNKLFLQQCRHHYSVLLALFRKLIEQQIFNLSKIPSQV